VINNRNTVLLLKCF